MGIFQAIFFILVVAGYFVLVCTVSWQLARVTLRERFLQGSNAAALPLDRDAPTPADSENEKPFRSATDDINAVSPIYH